MCGRFALDVHGDAVFDSFDWLERGGSDASWVPQRNIAPTDSALVVGARPGARPTLRRMRWGFDGAAKIAINARVETLDTRPLFQRAFRHGRCLVPASGYYEWYDAGDGKQAYYAQDSAGQLLLMAALYGKQRDGVFGFVVVTQPSEAGAHHPRMPLLVPAAERRRWLEEHDPRRALVGAAEGIEWKARDPRK